jgi:hypothetical protein
MLPLVTSKPAGFRQRSAKGEYLRCIRREKVLEIPRPGMDLAHRILREPVLCSFSGYFHLVSR